MDELFEMLEDILLVVRPRDKRLHDQFQGAQCDLRQHLKVPGGGRRVVGPGVQELATEPHVDHYPRPAPYLAGSWLFVSLTVS